MPVEKWELRKAFTFNLPWLGQKCSSFEWHKLSHLASPAHNIHRQQLCKAGQDQECWRRNGTSHLGRYLYRWQHSDKINFGNQAEAQNSKDLSDEVNSMRDVVFQMIFQCWQKVYPSKLPLK